MRRTRRLAEQEGFYATHDFMGNPKPQKQTKLDKVEAVANDARGDAATREVAKTKAAKMRTAS